MRISKSAAVAAAVALNAHTTSAATASNCPTNGVCYQWGVPEASAKAGSGDIYFQLKAPTSFQWIGLGIGSQMAGASIFVMYQNGNGNVTLSTRQGQGHVMPNYQARSDVQLLAGSGVVGGNMIANVRCSGCSNLDLSGSTNWIAAWKSGDSLASTNPSAIITQHDDESQFQVNLGSASISSNSNPFLGSDSNSGSNGGNTGGGTGGGYGGGGNSGNGNSGSSGGARTGPSTNTLVNAHGIVMSIIFVCMYPIGSILMPLLGKWYIHASWQFIAFLGMWAGFGLGYVASRRLNIFFDEKHTRIGVFVVALLALQPIFGWIHHVHYVKTQSRGIFSTIHVWYGRALMVLGIINGGFGLQLAGTSNRFVIAYSVVAGVLILLYLGSIFVGVSKRRGQDRRAKSPPMMTQES